MTLLCDWCRHTPAFYTHKNKCGMDYPDFKGRDENCEDFDPEFKMVNVLDNDKEWEDFVRFYGEPHPGIAEKLRPRKVIARLK